MKRIGSLAAVLLLVSSCGEEREVIQEKPSRSHGESGALGLAGDASGRISRQPWKIGFAGFFKKTKDGKELVDIVLRDESEAGKKCDTSDLNSLGAENRPITILNLPLTLGEVTLGVPVESEKEIWIGAAQAVGKIRLEKIDQDHISGAVGAMMLSDKTEMIKGSFVAQPCRID